jgi:hypothetical protein
VQSESHYRSSAYGLVWDSDVPLLQFDQSDAAKPSDVRISRIAQLPPRALIAPVRVGAVFADGTRFPWRQQAVFDMIDGNRIDYLPGSAWDGALPHAFYGTVVAHLLAWRGVIPMHACAVAIDGRAVLIAGTAGAGKSSLTAGVIAAGAELLSDDLSALSFDPVNTPDPVILPGRTTIRLDPVVAAWSDGDRIDLPPEETRGKVVLRPAARSLAALPLAGVIALGLPPGTLSPVNGARFLARHLFRPVWLAALPNHLERQRALLNLAAFLPVIGFPAVAGGGREAHERRARDALALAQGVTTL